MGGRSRGGGHGRVFHGEETYGTPVFHGRCVS